MQTNKDIKDLKLYGIVFNPALNDGMEGKIRCEANQWILDINGNVTDIRHRLNGESINEILEELASRANLIMNLNKKDK